MSEETPNTETTPTEAEEAPAVASNASTEDAAASPAKSEENTVPVSALTKERAKAQAKIQELETKLSKIAEAEEERKRSELDEVERAKLEAQEAKAQAEQLQTALVQEQRKQVALAAASGKFQDPSDALRYVDLSGDDLSPEDIQDAVAKVLDEKPYLKAEQKGPAQTSGVEDGGEAKKAQDGASATASILSDAARIIGR